jgi:hypothetical protein
MILFNKRLPILLILSLLVLPACNTHNVQQEPTTIVLSDINLPEKQKTITTSTRKIDTLTPNIPEVKVETAKINNVANTLLDDDKAIQEYKKEIVRLNNLVKTRDEEINQLKAEAQKAFNNMLSIGMYIGGALSLVGILLTLLGGKLPIFGGYGVAVLGAGLCTTIFCYTLTTQAKWLAPIGGLILIPTAIWTVWKSIRQLKEDDQYEDAITDLVKTVELLKPELKDGWKSIEDKIQMIQRPFTQQLVKLKKQQEVFTKTRI